MTPRRWLLCANAPLASLITRVVGNSTWVLDAAALAGLAAYATDSDIQTQWIEVRAREGRGADWE